MRFAVILAGGGGTRLWPASRRQRPKQYLTLTSGETMLGATARRLEAVVGPGHLRVVTTADQVPAAREALPHLAPTSIFAEPAARNTAAAIGLAAVHLAHHDPGAILGVIPADQHVGDETGFRGAVERAYALAAERDAIVTLGIRPTHAETGFGYLEPGVDLGGGAHEVRRFVEKPDAATAAHYVVSGYLWNAGMFFLSARRALAEIARHLPDLGDGLAQIAAALAESPARADEVAAAVYPGFPRVSFDHGVMDRTQGILTVLGDFGWNDVGSWSAVAEVGAKDAAGNVARPPAVLLDARRNLVSADPGVVVALVGVDDLVVVQAGNAVLVMPRAQAQDVRAVVKALEERGLSEYL